MPRSRFGWITHSRSHETSSRHPGNRSRRQWSAGRTLGRVCLLTGALGPLGAALAAEPAADDALVEKVTAAVIKALEENEQILEPAVDRGIQRYLDRQKAAREEAQAQQVRIAQEKAKNVRPPAADRDHIRGKPDAKISLIEYSDFECPYCKRFHDTPKKILEKYGDSVNWVYRHFPLSFHNPGAQKQAEATECAAELGGGDAFWRYADTLYARTNSGGKGFPLDQLAPLAEEVGLDRGAFETCLDSGRYTERVSEDLKEGSSVGITGTPGNILRNNETGDVRLLSGALPVSTFDASIAELMGNPTAGQTQ